MRFKSFTKSLLWCYNGKIENYVGDVTLTLTDNFDNPKKIRNNIMEVVLDNLSVGIDPDKCTFVIQSQIPSLFTIIL